MPDNKAILSIFAILQTFKKLTGLHFFSFNVRGTPNPGWKALEYDPRLTVSQLSKNPSPPQSFKAKFTLENLISKFPASRVSINGNIVELTIDVVIIGSGSGGGLMASELAKAGLQVLVLEKGGYYDSHDFRSWNEVRINLSALFPLIYVVWLCNFDRLRLLTKCTTKAGCFPLVMARYQF